MRNSVLLFLTVSLLVTSAFAKLDCRAECTATTRGKCVTVGSLGRAAALHLNEILNAAEPPVKLSWLASKCSRKVAVAAKTVLSAGADCTEWGDPFVGQAPTHEDGPRSILRGSLKGEITQVGDEVVVSFDSSNLPDFSFVSKGEVTIGGLVESISHVPSLKDSGSPRLLISTAAACFALE